MRPTQTWTELLEAAVVPEFDHFRLGKKRLLANREGDLISQKVLTESFCKNQFPYKSVNSFSTFIIIKNELVDLCGIIKNELTDV